MDGCGYFIDYLLLKTVKAQLSPHLPYKEGSRSLSWGAGGGGGGKDKGG